MQTCGFGARQTIFIRRTIICGCILYIIFKQKKNEAHKYCTSTFDTSTHMNKMVSPYSLMPVSTYNIVQCVRCVYVKPNAFRSSKQHKTFRMLVTAANSTIYTNIQHEHKMHKTHKSTQSKRLYTHTYTVLTHTHTQTLACTQFTQTQRARIHSIHG